MTAIDTTRPFMPESLTPLAYTAIYRDLSDASPLTTVWFDAHEINLVQDQDVPQHNLERCKIRISL